MEKKDKIVLIFVLIFAIGFVASFGYTYKTMFQTDDSQTIATIMIDAGHGGYDPGSIGSDGTYEKDITLSIALQVGKMINQMDSRINVIYTRTTDDVPWPSNESEDLAYRVAMATQADYFLAIHCDAADNTEATGYTFYIRQNDATSLQICHSISDNLKTVHWSTNNGVEYTSSRALYVVDNQSIPATLFETGYISNDKECSKMKKWYNQKLIAYSIAKGYVDYIQKNTNE